MGHDAHAHDSHGLDSHGHDDHGHDDHGHDAHGHDDHDAHAHHGGPDPYIVNPTSEVVATQSNTALSYMAFIGIFVVIAIIIKLAA